MRCVYVLTVCDVLCCLVLLFDVRARRALVFGSCVLLDRRLEDQRSVVDAHVWYAHALRVRFESLQCATVCSVVWFSSLVHICLVALFVVLSSAGCCLERTIMSG